MWGSFRQPVHPKPCPHAGCFAKGLNGMLSSNSPSSDGSHVPLQPQPPALACRNIYRVGFPGIDKPTPNIRPPPARRRSLRGFVSRFQKLTGRFFGAGRTLRQPGLQQLMPAVRIQHVGRKIYRPTDQEITGQTSWRRLDYMERLFASVVAFPAPAEGHLDDLCKWVNRTNVRGVTHCDVSFGLPSKAACMSSGRCAVVR
jgi:hypothetical protein